MTGLERGEPWWKEADQEDPFLYYLQEVLLAFSGWATTRRKRPALALAVASLCAALAQGGPIPVTHSARAARLFAVLSLVYPLCGLALASLVSLTLRWRWVGGK
jgi:hypothetical protein